MSYQRTDLTAEARAVEFGDTDLLKSILISISDDERIEAILDNVVDQIEKNGTANAYYCDHIYAIVGIASQAILPPSQEVDLNEVTSALLYYSQQGVLKKFRRNAQSFSVREGRDRFVKFGIILWKFVKAAQKRVE